MERALPPVLENSRLVAPFLLTRMIAPGSPRMTSEEKCFKVWDTNPAQASISAALVNHNLSRTTT